MEYSNHIDVEIDGRFIHEYDFFTGEKLEPIYLREASYTKAPPVRAVT
ncbi:MAG TPA: hypothetical protein VH619_04965 [Verrucomicrobiae bacterium]|nr:hypothetical protein [Verrucomicrobiae bacterium]